MNSSIPDKGKLLVSEPSIIGNDSFSRSVILVTEHNPEGVVGFIINKPLNFTLNQLIPDIELELEVYEGGPVDKDNLYFLHNVPHLIPNSYLIHDNIYWGGDFESVSSLINDGTITSGEIRFFLGYAGWDVHQLESELEGKSWVVVDHEKNQDLLSLDTYSIWKNHMRTLGGDYEMWSNAPDNPQYN